MANKSFAGKALKDRTDAHGKFFDRMDALFRDIFLPNVLD